MFKRCKSLLLFLSIFHIAKHDVPFVLATSSGAKIVDLGYATYRSDLSLVPGVTSFLGVRYAAAPTGEQRWRKPQPPATAREIQDATTPPNECFQAFLEGAMGTSLTNPFRGLPDTNRKRSLEIKRRDSIGETNEDCLFLNVHVPTKAPKSQLPVIVYIHGGAYDAGNATLYPGQDFVISSNYQLITVDIQYRLGVLGFLSGTKLGDDGDLNVGLLDQNFALQWVQKHIAAFGGDPTKVTIWGQSAGAGSVLQHIVAHAGNTQPPLFHAVMMNSPFLPPQYSFNDPITESLYSRVVSHVGCSGAKDTMDCLRSVSAEALQDADSDIGLSGFLGTYSFLPVVDGSFITERPTVTLKRGRVNGNTLLVSNNANEGGLFVPATVLIQNNVTLEEWVTQMFPRFSQLQVSQTVALYSATGGTVPDQAALIMGEAIFDCPALYTLLAFGQRGFKAEFAIPPAFHGDDLPYEFEDIGIPRQFTNPQFQKAWQQSFLSVALSLSPNAHFDPTNITPTWSPWAENQSEMLFNMTATGAPVVKTSSTGSTLSAHCSFWSNLTPTNSQ